MSNSPVYVLANLVIKNSERYREYEKGFFPLLKRHEGKLITFDDNSIELEKGEVGLSGRFVLFSFLFFFSFRIFSRKNVCSLVLFYRTTFKARRREIPEEVARLSSLGGELAEDRTKEVWFK